MNKVMDIATYHAPQAPATQRFTQHQVEILKNSICRGISDEEFAVFLMACSKTQLDPFMKQIYCVKRKSKRPDGSWGESMTIQTGIDGYRLIAERTERYAPGPEPTYVCDENGNVISATAYIKKQTKDGTWHSVSSSAYMIEYCQTFNGKPASLWATMPRTMLAKCAEAQALRKAFPAEMSGVYTKEEMMQADEPTISLEQAHELNDLLEKCDKKYQDWMHKTLESQYKTSQLDLLHADVYESLKNAILKRLEEIRMSKMPAKEVEIVDE